MIKNGNTSEINLSQDQPKTRSPILRVLYLTVLILETNTKKMKTILTLFGLLFLTAWLPAEETAVSSAVLTLETDVCVVGAGCGGIGAALAAGREGAAVILVEKEPRLGGTGVEAFAASWEAGPGCEFAEELFHRMKALGGAGVAKSRPIRLNAPYGTRLIDPDEPEEPYEMSLVRAAPPEGDYRSVPYDPIVFDRVVREMLAETGKVTVLDRTEMVRPETNADRTRVTAIRVRKDNGSVMKITARVFIDSTGSVALCRGVGSPVRIGREGRSEFGESLAPEKPDRRLNALTRCYKIEPRENPRREEIAPEDVVDFPKAAWVTGRLDGARFINMTGILPGEKMEELGCDEVMTLSEKIVKNHWRWLQESPDFADYELTEIAPMMGIREDWRITARYMLCQRDLLETWENQTHPDMIAVADHPCDIHGPDGGLVPVKSAYGIPYRCLIPDDTLTNLLVACRGAGFTHVAASSCRLQRTMLQLGHAAGAAAAWSVQNGCGVEEIDAAALTKKMNARARYPR